MRNASHRWKRLTDDLSGRKVAISFSNKAVDCAFAKDLDKLLNAEGALPKLLNKFPVKDWVHACVWAAEEADFVVILHSVNYDEGNYSAAERFLVKESNVPHLVLEIDTPSHADYCASADAAIRNIRESLVLTQEARVETKCVIAHRALKRFTSAFSRTFVACSACTAF